MAKQKYYVVWVGKETGIFTDWSKVQPLVAGYPGAKHKSYTSMGEARKAFESSEAVTKTVKTNAKQKKKKPAGSFVFDTTYSMHIFSDGACDPNPGEAGSGVAVYESGQLSELWYGSYEPLGTNNTAELNALHQALKIAAERKENGHKVQVLSDSSYSVNAMVKWAAGWEKNGWTRKGDNELANKELIADMYGQYKSLNSEVDLVHVKGHSGVEGNELADRLSMLALRNKIAGFQLYEGVDTIQQLLDME